MKRSFWLLVLLLMLGTSLLAVQTIKLVAWTVGPDDPSINRKLNLDRAAEMLNAMLEASGSDIRIELVSSFDSTDWSSYKQRALIAFQSPDQQLDIITSGHDDIGMWAKAGYVRPLDEYIKKFWNLGFYDIIPSLWEAMKFKGKIYGVPQDTEARPFYARKDKLLAMGYTEEEIADMMEKFATGEYTLYDAVKISQEAIKAGVVKWGIWHRPKPGVDYFQIFNSFGVQYYDPDQGKLVFDKAGYLKAFQFFYDICNTYKVTPKNLIGTPWNTIHRSFAGPEGDVLFYLGGTWNVAEWMNMFGYTKEDIKAKFTYTLVPSAEKGKPGNTISHPVAYMVTSKSKYPELATLLILLASDARLNAIHAVNSGHLAIRYAELSLPMYAEDDFLTDTAKKLLPYATFAPNNDRFNEYNKIIFDAMTGLESGKMTPKFAVEWVVQRLRAQLKDEVIIK
ncbi:MULTISPECIES: ABC transporter substrate-binding protein [Kosmotoga]|uniref:Extracellular solute-binding protein family 1 n=1 Tax=Kosmotoga olearia (strain ATCC BAA-1733 / DSM 21960 / TBF 19.5.1) TaxID=521045 RepID=C5CH29_KOSOT|nr:MULTISPECIES: extracellular solute-binding protein [Kosmotoga]ACR79694.1 extracellular solute-binding protein family 1 [Kosmotoga olearia TBF 19.5.1]MDI3524575.1 inositol-phosphate transport system substrate-binding protein [Kosmotoga sp.]MDK2953871.1 inositol-phosphate transport system substrate-binding protein [Kosmotoga sp.]OAA21933.1 hypothetical protein DU53_05230 [Kosmotoga sp. DU53]